MKSWSHPEVLEHLGPNRQTNERTFAFHELLLEPKMHCFVTIFCFHWEIKSKPKPFKASNQSRDQPLQKIKPHTITSIDHFGLAILLLRLGTWDLDFKIIPFASKHRAETIFISIWGITYPIHRNNYIRKCCWCSLKEDFHNTNLGKVIPLEFWSCRSVCFQSSDQSNCIWK